MRLDERIMALDDRRRRLGMSRAALSHLSGVPIATVNRILAGQIKQAAVSNVARIAHCLGMDMTIEERTGDVQFVVRTDEDEFCRRRAQSKAEAIVAAVQGTSALEAQGIGRDAMRRMIEKTICELLAGSTRRLWSH